MHSTWSDGSQTLEDIVEAGIARGYDFCAVTDHSYGLKIAGGVSMAELAQAASRHRPAEREVPRTIPAVKGIEANIRADGSVDMEPDELRLLEIVVAAPHSALRSAADQTARHGTAVRRRASTFSVTRAGACTARVPASPPTGTRSSRRQVARTWPSRSTAIPSRQDVDYDLARRAVDAGCLFALDSDAHSTPSFRVRRNRASRTLGSPVSPPIASSIAGRSIGCSRGWQGPANRLRRGFAGPEAGPTGTAIAGELAMIQPRRAIELGDDRGQLDPNPPLVSPATHLLDRGAPPVPPARDAAGDRLDHQHAIAGGCAIEQALHERVQFRDRLREPSRPA